MFNDETDFPFNFKHFFVPLTTVKAICFIITLGFIIFFNMLFNGFAGDYTSYILENPEVHSMNIPVFFQQNYFNDAGQYRAVTELYISVMYALFSSFAFFYHFIQLLLHIANGVMVYFLLK